jgi:hypothetical protein
MLILQRYPFFFREIEVRRNNAPMKEIPGNAQLYYGGNPLNKPQNPVKAHGISFYHALEIATLIRKNQEMTGMRQPWVGAQQSFSRPIMVLERF